MGKLNKILLGGLICATSFAFTSNVKADGGIIDQLRNSGKAEYQVYENGSTIYYNKTNHYVCDSSYGQGCSSYTVSEDDGKKDDVIKLTSSSDSLYVNKADIADGYVISANKNIEIYFSEEKKSDELSGTASDITKIKYFREFDDIANLIKNAKKYDNFNLSKVNTEYMDITVPEGVTLTSWYFSARNVINNGKIKTGAVNVKKITGTGNITLYYNVYIGDWAGNDTPVYDAERFDIENTSGIKVDVVSTKIKEGMSFGVVGTTTGYSKEEAQNKLDMYNDVLGSSMNGYELKLAKYKVDGDDEYYYGVLAKKSDVKTTTKSDNKSNGSDTKNNDAKDINNTKKEIKNPSTSDATNITAIMLMISGAIAAITFKKVKQR
ncbi:MAG: hypothetical protein ACI4UZ_02970 [Candidatus Aphodocola sp.]